MLFNPANLSYWIFLVTGVSLFVLVIVTGSSDHDGDAEFELNSDADGLELDAHGDTEFDLGDILGWFGVGRAPLILLLAIDLSLLGVVGWMLNVVVGSITGQIPGGFAAGILLVTASTIALTLGSLIARPLGKVFAQFSEDTTGDRLIGCVGTVSSAIVPAHVDRRIGQVDVLDAAQNFITIPTTLPDWATIVPQRGEKVLVIDRQPNVYIVIAKDSPDQDRWFHQATKR
jgi:hypothetical protein